MSGDRWIDGGYNHCIGDGQTHSQIISFLEEAEKMGRRGRQKEIGGAEMRQIIDGEKREKGQNS